MHTQIYIDSRTPHIHIAQCTPSGINQPLNIPSQERNTNPLFISGAKRDYSRSIIINAPKVDEWEIPACNVIVEQQLGEGCFGQVFKGVVKGPISNPKVQPSLKNAICVNVAIKMLKRKGSMILALCWHICMHGLLNAHTSSVVEGL